NYRWYFDYDAPNDGNLTNQIDSADYNQFQQRYGSALAFSLGTVMATDCTITGNSAANGGGIDNSKGSTFVATNCTMSGNSSTAGGGGILNDGIYVATNCTMAANAAGGAGGGISNIDSDGATTTLTNTIVAGNSASSGGSDISGAVTANHSLI